MLHSFIFGMIPAVLGSFLFCYAGNYQSDSIAVREILRYAELEKFVYGLSWVNASDIDSFAVVKNGRITELDLSFLDQGEFTDLSPAIGELDALEKLNILLVKSIPPEIGKLTNLKNLEILSCIKKYPDEFGNLKNLERLKIVGNCLENDSWPLLCQLESLNTLVAYDSKNLTQLPECFGNLENLGYLDLWKGHLSELPDSFSNLQKLWYLKLDDNPLGTFPEEITQLDRLVNLFVRKCQLTSLPPTIGNLDNLHWLMMHENNFQSLPDELMNLDSLTYVTGGGQVCDASQNVINFLNTRNGTFTQVGCPGTAIGTHPVLKTKGNGRFQLYNPLGKAMSLPRKIGIEFKKQSQ